MEFQATIQLNGKTATGIQVPPEIVEALGHGKRPAVLVTINGHAYRSTVATVDGVFMLPVSAEVRDKACVVAGDSVTVTVAPDTAPREVTVPPELQAAFAADGSRKAAFDALSYSKQRQLVEPIAAAKTDETRQRRVDKALQTLR